LGTCQENAWTQHAATPLQTHQRLNTHPAPQTCAPDSSKAAAQLHKLLIDVGPEIASGYTKGGQYIQIKVRRSI
jgi:hypothetical protein